jgi:hypothetical protein
MSMELDGEKGKADALSASAPDDENAVVQTDDGNAKVTNLETHRKRRGKKSVGSQAAEPAPADSPSDEAAPPKPKKKATKAEFARAIAGAMFGDPLSTLPPFGQNFAVVEDDEGVRVPVRISAHRVVSYVSPEAVVNSILDYTHKTCAGAWAQTTPADARMYFDLWKALAEPLDERSIKPVAQASDHTSLCLRRLPWDLEPGDTPAFDELFSRIDNGFALKAWIGSLFVQASDRQQYCWIYGEGRNGKGSLASFLHRVFGPSYRAETVPEKGNRFWTSGLLGSRLVVFPDCNNYTFVTTGLFKSLTGGDAVRVERKGLASSTAILQSKFLFLSNTKPALTSKKADRRRVIYCVANELAKDTKIIAKADYDAMLWKEGPAFIMKCLSAFKACESAGEIPTESLEIEALILGTEEPMEILFKRYMTVREEPAGLDVSERQYVDAQDLRRVVCMGEKMSNHDYREFLEFIGRRYGGIYKQVSVKGCKVWRYVGVSFNNETLKDYSLKARGV